MSVCFSGGGWVLCVGPPEKVKKKKQEKLVFVIEFCA
jgi:hypothetical protein